MQRRKMEWGRTPWSSYSAKRLGEQLRFMLPVAELQVRVLTHAAMSAPPGNPFWESRGTGGWALAAGEQALHKFFADAGRRLSQEESLRHVQRLYAAIHAMAYPANAQPWQEPVFGSQKLVEVRLEAARQGTALMESIHGRFDAESMFRAFYRYAYDLLFEGLGSDWNICDACGEMAGKGRTEKFLTTPHCTACRTTHATAVSAMRRITWADLAPLTPKEKSRDAA